MTTRDPPDGIVAPDDAWVQGGSRKESYVSPWYVTTLKRRDLDDQQGTLAESVVGTAIEALHGYTPPPDG